MRKLTSKSKKGFTLIELLVVIAIIALLLAILMPGLKAAKNIAKKLICSSNARQLTLGWINYAQDHDQKLVLARPGPDGWENNGNPETGLLWSYVESRDCYVCPAGIKGYDVTYAICDGMNTNVTAPGMTKYISRKMTEISMPCERLVFIDEGRSNTAAAYTQENNRTRWWDPVPCRHGEATGVSMADGHVETWKWKDERSKLWTYEEWKNNFGSSPHRTQLNNEDLIKMQRYIWGTLQ